MSTAKKNQEPRETAPATSDLLDQQYHDIGIPAVAAACRYQHEAAEAHDEADHHGGKAA